MDIAGALQVLLAVVLLVSGVAKSLDPAGTRTATAALGVPRTLVGATALLLPVAEVATAVLLLATPALGLLLAGALLLTFTLVVARTLLRGAAPSCACFGRLGGAEVSGRTLARNGLLLAAVAATAALGPARPDLPALLLGTALAGGLLLLEARGPGPAARNAVPGDLPELTALDGTTRRDLLRPGRPVLVVVLSPGCGPCLTVPAALQRWRSGHEGDVGLLVVSSGEEAEVRALTAVLDGVPVVLDPTAAVSGPLGVYATPGAVLLDGRGAAVAPPQFGPGGVAALWEQALAGTGHVRAEAATLTADFVPVPAAGVVVRPEPDGGALLVDELTGAQLRLDRVGALVWSVLDGTGSVQEIAADLAEAFAAPVEAVRADVLALVRELGATGVLRGVRPVERDEPVPTEPAALA